MIALMKRILNVSGRYKKNIQLAFVFSFLKSFIAKAPIMLSTIAIMSFITGTASVGICIGLGIAMVVCLVLQMIFHHIADRLQSAAGFMVFADKRMELGRHLRKMPMGYFTEGNIGKISSVLSSDMVFIEENCMNVLADMMSYVFSTAIFVIFMFFFNGWVGLLTAAIVGILALIGNGMRKEAIEDSSKRQEQNENLTESVLDFTEGISIIKTYNLLGEKSKELTENFRRSCDVMIHFEEAHTPWQRMINLVCSLGSVAVMTLAVILNRNGMLETANFIAMMLFVFEIFAPLKALYGQSTRLTVMNSCMDRIEEVFAETELHDNGTASIPKTGKYEIEFENVSFAYDKKDVLHDISFTLEKNNMLALVGPSGGGKSTVANLIARFWDIKSGSIKVRGVDIRNVPLSQLMDNISMVFQRVYLFQDTIYNNIIMGKPDANEEEVYAAAKKARCYDFIMALPEGFQTIVGEGGASLSGGEKQRISIARCILKDAPIVILDEATASVDADNESYIQQAISELCNGKTLIVIAHRLGTIRNANKILVVKDGGIAESGNHDTLMEQNGIYRNFVTMRENTVGWNARG
ncbi:MAG: ABC transporter ATP-binding protein [Lachnospiraceae bacterium]|nr:ABC transporter ATP-binding protein [Lachnospiraceae bacterium]